jgi:hypothetical protein
MGVLRRLYTVTAIAAAASLLIVATPARAAVNQQDFQIDGDATEATCGGAFGTTSCPPAQPDDWDSLYSCPASPSTAACSKITTPGANLADVIGDMADEFNFPDTDNLTQGSKDDQNITAWNWGPASGSAKTNIMQSFAAKYGASLYIGGNRDVNNGDANFGVWLLQNQTVKCTATMVSAGQCGTAGTFVGKPNAQGFRSLVPHAIGDILLVSAFTNGGTVANIQVYKVIQTVGNESNPNAVPGTCPATAFDGYANKSTGATGVCLQQLITVTQPGTGACNSAITGPPAVPANAACAATNAGTVTALDPRFQSSQSGSVKGKYPPLTFFEVGLQLDDLNLTSECFPNYLVDGRQSQSVTSSLNDFTLGSFQHCSSGIVTQASGPVTVGQTITDTATVSGTPGGPTPTGSVTFNAYSDSACTTQVFTSTKTVTGFGNYTSDSYTTTAAGTIYWIAHYTGDSNFPAADGSCGDANESSVVNKASPAITTSATAGPVNIGDPIHDTATLTGGFAPLTGTVTFTLYGPNDATCSNASIFTSTVSVVSGGATSGNFTTTAAGTGYRWKASYSGDGNNSGATSGCGDSNESSAVNKGSPKITTNATASVTVGATINDTATLTGGAAPLTGTVTFTLYGPNDATCSNASIFTSTVPVVSGGATSANFTTTAAGTGYRWTASYSGDGNNSGATSGCGDANESSTVNRASPGITTNATAGPVAIGDPIHDTATLSGGYASLTGTVTFTLYGPNDATCSNASIFTSTVPVVSGGATSANFTTTAAGTGYRWTAVYNGDSNNNPATSGCNAANEASAVAKGSPTALTAPTVKVILSDSATISGGSSPTGTLTFNLYQNTTCTGATAWTKDVTVVAGTSQYFSGDSPQFTVSTPGTEFRWVVVYTPDSNNNGFTTGCGVERAAITIAP